MLDGKVNEFNMIGRQGAICKIVLKLNVLFIPPKADRIVNVIPDAISIEVPFIKVDSLQSRNFSHSFEMSAAKKTARIVLNI